jgi:Domain of unknown function (DUF4397)
MKGWLGVVSVLAIGAMLAACGDGRSRPPQVKLIVAHAAPSFPEMRFYRGASGAGFAASIPFRSGAVFSFDADTYDYRLGISTTSGEQIVRTFTHTLSADSQYFYVFAESAGSLEELILSQPPFPVDSSSTEFSIVHASEASGAMDIYVEPPGTDLQFATPRATLSFREHQAPTTAPPGDYVVTVTESGAVANVLFQSPTLTFVAGVTRALVIAGTGNSGTAPLTLIVANDAPASVSDANAPSAVRVINGAGDRAAHDVYINNDFSAPLIGAQAFGTASEYADIAAADTTFSITPEANPSVIEHELTQTMLPEVIYSLTLGGESGNLTGVIYSDDRRRTLNEARIRFFNLVNYYTALNLYLVPPGTDITSAIVTFQLTPRGATARVPFGPREYELTITDTATGTTVFGPQPVSMATPGVYSIVTLDAGDGTNVDILLLDDFL